MIPELLDCHGPRNPDPGWWSPKPKLNRDVDICPVTDRLTGHRTMLRPLLFTIQIPRQTCQLKQTVLPALLAKWNELLVRPQQSPHEA
jgi:hypothetical protein